MPLLGNHFTLTISSHCLKSLLINENNMRWVLTVFAIHAVAVLTHFIKSQSNDGRFSVGAQFQTIHNARCHREDILQRATNLHCRYVRCPCEEKVLRLQKTNERERTNIWSHNGYELVKASPVVMINFETPEA